MIITAEITNLLCLGRFTNTKSSNLMWSQQNAIVSWVWTRNIESYFLLLIIFPMTTKFKPTLQWIRCEVKPDGSSLYTQLGHQLANVMTNVSEKFDDVPQFTNCVPILNVCSTCIQADLTINTATSTALKATQPFHFLIDFRFTSICSNNTKCLWDYLDFHGEICWLLITEHFFIYILGRTFKSKTVPLHHHHDWLALNCSTCDNTWYAYLDQDREMYGSIKATKISEQHVSPTSLTGSENTESSQE